MPSPAKKSAASAAKSATKPLASKAETTPAAMKPAAKGTPAAEKAPPAGKAPPGTAVNPPAKGTLSPAERMKMIAEAAYFLAQKRGFTGGDQLSDWVAAERQVDAVAGKRG